MATIGLITEGITDQIVISYILYGWLKDEDVFITELQPKRSEADADIATTSGNWDKVLKYCASDDFKEAFKTNMEIYVIVHLDADVFKSGEVTSNLRFSFKKEEGTDLTTLEIIEHIQSIVIQQIGTDFYEKHKERIIFAIAVDEIECWLLPIYYSDNRRAKTVKCLDTLNQKLKKEGYRIDAKRPKYYRKASKPYLKAKKIYACYDKNESLKAFCELIDGSGLKK